MCVIYLALDQHPGFPLILLANRDEFYARRTLAAHFWADAPDIYAGRDLEAGGTWLGVTRSGRFAAVTNYRDPFAPTGSRSRGELVADFLKSNDGPNNYVAKISRRSDEYSGFNLIVGKISSSGQEVVYYSNRGGVAQQLVSGLYGLSNHLLDTPWPKVIKGKERVRTLLTHSTLESAKYFEILADKTLAQNDELPSTGIPFDLEKSISAIFIETPGYGTRCSTILTFDNEMQWNLDEKTWV